MWRESKKIGEENKKRTKKGREGRVLWKGGERVGGTKNEWLGRRSVKLPCGTFDTHVLFVLKCLHMP